MSVTVASRTTVKGQTSVGGFSPASLFLNNEQGVWYDPSDMTTMFQDSALTTPVTGVEQPVGFLMDKSRGATLGSELIINGEFNSSSSWILVGGWSVSGGKLVGTGATNWARQDNIITSGKWYKVSFEVSSYTGGNTIRICNTSGVALVSFYVAGGAPNTYTGYFLATGTSVIIEAATTPFSGTIDNFSIRELPGNHAYQSTSANRPVLSARVNLLTYSEDMTNAVWTKRYCTATSTVITATNTSDVRVFQSYITTITGTWTYTAKILKGRNFVVGVTGDSSGVAANFNGTTGDYVNSASTGSIWTLNSYSCVSHPNDLNYWLVTVTATNSSSDSNLVFGFSGINNSFVTTWPNWNATVGDTLTVTNHDLRLTNQGVNLPVYQRVGAATYGTSTTAGVGDYDTTNFPMYLKFDGSNDYLVGSDANMPTGDLSIFSGSYTNTDSYGALISYGKAISGNAVALAYGPAAISYLLGVSQYGGFSGISNSINKTFVFSVNRTGNNYSYRRNNGSSVSSDTMTSSTSVYGNNGLTIGSNNEAQSYNLKFNGYIYGLIIRGASSNALQIAGAENWLNQKTKAYA